MKAGEMFRREVSALMNARGCSWDEAWTLQRAMSPELYRAMDEGREATPGMANTRHGQGASGQFREVVERLMGAGLSYDEAWNMAKGTRADLYNALEGRDNSFANTSENPDPMAEFIPKWAFDAVGMPSGARSSLEFNNWLAKNMGTLSQEEAKRFISEATLTYSKVRAVNFPNAEDAIRGYFWPVAQASVRKPAKPSATSAQPAQDIIKTQFHKPIKLGNLNEGEGAGMENLGPQGTSQKMVGPTIELRRFS